MVRKVFIIAILALVALAGCTLVRSADEATCDTPHARSASASRYAPAPCAHNANVQPSACSHLDGSL